MPNRSTVLRQEAIREALRAQGDVPDGREIAPLDIMMKVANRLYSKALHARAQGNYALEAMLLKAAASAAASAAPFCHPRMPVMAITPNAIPPLRQLTLKQLQQLLTELGEGDGEDVTSANDGGRVRGPRQDRVLEGAQSPEEPRSLPPPPSGPPNGWRPRR